MYGWQVQVPGHPSEFFADSKHGGEVGSFREARQRAGELADGSRVNLKTRRFVRSPGAADGVFRIEVRGYSYWVAECSPEPGKTKQARFSVGKWGEAGAKRKARDERAKNVAALLGWPGVRKVPDILKPALTAAGIEHDIKAYPGAGHGFLNDHDPNDLSPIDKVIAILVAGAYHESSTRDARDRILAFFRVHLVDLVPIPSAKKARNRAYARVIQRAFS